MEGVAEVQLNVTHSNQLVREEAQGKIKALLDASSSEVSLVPSTGVAADFLEGLKTFSNLCKRHTDLVKCLERSIGRDGFYKLIGLTHDSIHFHVKVYTIEGLRWLQSDVQSGRIGHQLGKVLVSEKNKQLVLEDIVLDVAPEGSGAWDLLSHAVIDPILPSTSLSIDFENREALNEDRTSSSDLMAHQGHPVVPESTVRQQIVTHEEENSGHLAGSSSLATPGEVASLASHVSMSQEKCRPDDAVDKEKDSATSTEKAHPGEASKKMMDWTEEEVAIWLKSNVHLSDELVSKLKGVDGFMLVRYTKAELIEDFELSATYCRRLMLRREHYLEKERMGMVATQESESSDRRDGNSKVSAMESVNTPSQEPTPPPATSADADEPVTQVESMQNTSSSSPMGNIQLDSRGVEASGKKQTTRAPSLSEVPVTSLEMEKDTVESTIDRETGYGSSYTSATPNPSEVDLILPPFDHPERQKSLYQGSGIGGMDSDSHTERKLTNLLLGSDKGELDSSYYPVLVVNTPAQQLSSAELEERFGFMSSVSWNVVFDCNADSNKTGLCQYVNQRKSIKILSADTFTVETEDVNALREGIYFPEIPVWVFPNGRNDVNLKGKDKMSDMDWMRERSHAVLNTVRFFSHPGVIPPGRAVVVLFLLSYSDIMVMTQLFREFYTSKSFQDLKRFTVIAENQGILHKWIQHLESQSIVSSKDMKDRCLGGVPWQDINTYMLRLLGSCETRLPVLPVAPKGQCDLMKKHQSQWTDISILAKNECENTSMDESNPKFLDFVQENELRYYQGHGVDWWNFYLSEERLNGGKGYNHVLKRQNYKRLYSDVHKVLTSQGKKVRHISMATVFHVAGSGGTTVAKNLLWDLHRQYRCAVVNRVTNDTVSQLVALHKYGYEEGQKPGPVVLLLENLDSETMRSFLISLERETRYLENNGLAFVLIHCKRTSEPERHQQKEESKPSICVEHTLTEEENQWFTKKTKDLEQRNVFNEKESPELLLAFMVMKKECNPEYLKNVVKGILPPVDKEPKKALLNAVNLLKYIAVVQMYNPGFAMPVSACDGFMQKQHRVMLSGRQQTFGPWEKDRQPFLNLLLLEEFIQDIDGCVKGLAIVHPVIATEIVDQLGEVFQQKPADMILELLEKSTILDTLSYSKGYIQKVCRDLMVRRLKKEYGDDRETDFAPFIEDVYAEDRAKAYKIMEVGIKKFQDPYIAQQKARLHSKGEDDFNNAEQAINIALGIVNNNSYLWDTRGIILRQKMMTLYGGRVDQEVTSDSEMKELLDTFRESCAAFQNAQKAMVEETRKRNYAGFVGEIITIGKFLEIVQKRVRPFRYRNEGLETLRKYLMTDYIPPEITLPSLLEFSDTMKSLSERVDEVLGRFTDYLVHCAQQRFGGASYRIYDDKLEKIYTARQRFFALSSPPLGKYPVETAYAMRRSEVKMLNADGYQQIFDMVSKTKVADLKHVQSLLRQNLGSPSLFDIRNFVFTLFALSVCSDEGLDEEKARKSVNTLKMMEEKDNGFYGLFFEMLLNWPDGTPKEGSTPIGETIRQLKAKWDSKYRNKVYAESRHDLTKRSKIRQHFSPMKPSTEFYLGFQSKKSPFVHRKSIGRVTYDIWKEDSIKKRLRRLNGVLDSKHFVSYNPDGEEPVKITLSLPIKGLPSQEPVQFYLGFSFAGPLAYDVVYKDNRGETPFIAKESSTNYPSYVNEIDDIDELLM
ncbi:sterile alpha motif domain-containing protein 9-like [Strongylocentrotus purpuratus]|uniref:SAM domain-containing protein n=1 Tax=Strongylocentrotus purpuratus TaxID=7668 RepID=A0A7M7PF49_STRPU|nr:sterile alpha motif domain-containing protein 9-like [Strongylocentrotus purpuratus]